MEYLCIIYICALRTEALRCVEYFAGVKSVVGAFRTALLVQLFVPFARRSLGHSGQSFELKDGGESEDLLSGIGFAYALSMMVRCMIGEVPRRDVFQGAMLPRSLAFAG